MRLWSSDANALVQIQTVMNKIFGSYLNTEHSEKPSSSNNNQASYQEVEVGLYRRFLKCIRQSLISALVLCCTCDVDYLSYLYSVHTFRNYQNTVLSHVPGSISKVFRGWMLQQWVGRTGARTDLEGVTRQNFWALRQWIPMSLVWFIEPSKTNQKPRFWEVWRDDGYGPTKYRS